MSDGSATTKHHKRCASTERAWRDGPLKLIQHVVQERLGGAEANLIWQTFEASDRSYYFRTVGELLPCIYILAAGLAALGSAYGLFSAAVIGSVLAWLLWVVLTVAAGVLIARPVLRQRPSRDKQGSTTY